MRRHVLIDELSVAIYAPRDLPRKAASALHRTLADPRVRRRLRRAIRGILQTQVGLDAVRVRLSS